MKPAAVRARILALAGSMTGRIFILLTVGMTIAVMTSLAVAEQIQCSQYERLRAQSIAESAGDVAGSLNVAPDGTRRMLERGAIVGARAAPLNWRIVPDASLVAALRQRLPDARNLVAGPASAQCHGLYDEATPRLAAGLRSVARFDCWYVRYADAQGHVRAFVVTYPAITFPRTGLMKPIFFVLLVIGSALLSILVSRWITRPVRNLETAARSFGISLDPEMVPEHGPSEIRTALATFNLMQRRVMEGFRQRTGLLASISHDLQTPLTRLRLRREKVADHALRASLIDDLNATQRLVREGLDLARSSESSEEWCWVDLDSMLLSLAEDAQEMGQIVSCQGESRITIRVTPGALERCLGNLIDNAVKYGGGADLSCTIGEAGQIALSVRDRGPGIAEDQMSRVFEPFVRGEGTDIPGTGIGLSIARAQAATFDSQIILVNHPDGGMLASVLFGSSIQWRRGDATHGRPGPGLRRAA